jgi:hypothetical protein
MANVSNFTFRKLHKRSFSNGRRWRGADLSQLVQPIGAIVQSIVHGFGRIICGFGFRLRATFDRFASVESGISNVVEVLFAEAFKGRTLKPSLCLINENFARRCLLEDLRSFQCD